MQERYLFRGRRLDNREWITGHVFINVKSTSIGVCSPTQRGAIRWFKCDPSTVMQCTGLRDKNGRLIFEGDVVELGGQYHPVKYKPMYAAFVLADCEYGLVLSWEFSDQMEVIGTIHATPELMEENDGQTD